MKLINDLSMERQFLYRINVSVATINQHIKKIYDDSEMEQESTIKKYLIVQTEGSRKVSKRWFIFDKYMLELEENAKK